MGKALIAVGLILAGLGLLIQIGLPLGRLPGDLVIRRGSATFYIPIVTCLLVSLVLSLAAAVFRRL